MSEVSYPVNKKIFIKKFKPILDTQTVRIFRNLYPKIKETFPNSKLYQSEQLKIEKNFLIYQNYVLESDWRNAPYEDFFRDFKRSSCIIDNKEFKFHIEDSFLKTKSKICFKFIYNLK